MTPEQERAPLTPAKVELGIRSAMDNLARLVTEYASAGDAAALADADYKLQWATARSDYRSEAADKGWKQTEAVTDDHATIHTYEALKTRLVSAQKAESIKLALRATQARLDALRSLGANIREVT